MGHRFLAFLRPRRAGGRRFLARARALFSQNHMNVRPILVESGFAISQDMRVPTRGAHNSEPSISP